MKAPFVPVRAGVGLVLDEVALPLLQARPILHVLVPASAAVLLLIAVLACRFENARTTAEIRSYEASAREATTARERLRLELAIRQGNGWLEHAAASYGLVPAAGVVRVEDAP